MVSNVIIIDSSPEPDAGGHRSAETSTLDDDPPSAGMDSQIQSSPSRKNKGKQKAPAPVVYDISSDDAETAPTYDEDEGEVQFTGMHTRIAATVAESSEESKKRKRASGSEPSGSHIGSSSATTAPPAQGSSSSAAFSGPSSSSTLNPAFTYTLTSGPAFSFTSGTNANSNQAAGPSGHTSLSSPVFHHPVVKKARFETDPVVLAASTSTTAAPTNTTAAPASTAVEHAQPPGFVTPVDIVAAATRLGVNNLQNLARNRSLALTAGPLNANAPLRAPSHAQRVSPPVHPPGPFYEAALLPPDHFYHDAVPPPAPPAPAPLPIENIEHPPNGADDRVVHYLRNRVRAFNGPVAQMYNHPPGYPDPALAARDYNPLPALVADQAELNQRLDADLAALRTRFPGAFGLRPAHDDAAQARQREDIQRQMDAEMARIHARVRERLREGEARREELRRARERAEEREREWQRELERQRERDREMEETIERIRQGARDVRERHARIMMGPGAEAGLDRGGGAGGGGGNLFAFRNRLERMGVDNDVDNLARLDINNRRAIELRLNAVDLEVVNNFLDDLNGDDAHGPAGVNNLDGGVQNPINVGMDLQNRLAGIQDGLGDLDNDLDRVGDGIDGLHDDIDAALGDFIENAARNVDHDNHNDIFANPLFAPPVAAPPAGAVDRPAQNPYVDGMGQEGVEAPFTDLEDDEDEDDIYVPNHEHIRSPADPPANGTVAVATGAPTAGIGPGPPVPTHGGGAPSQEQGAAATPQSVAGPPADVIDIEALLQDIPASSAAAGPPVAGPSNTANGASRSNSGVPDKPVDPIDAILASILEVVPDVLPEHAATLARTHFPSFGVMHTAEHVLGLLFESKDYPRRGKSKGKNKSKGKKEKATESLQADKQDAEGETDFLNTKMKGKPGRNYRRLALYHLRQSFPHARASQLATASSMRYARGHAYLTERLGAAPQPDNGHNADGGPANDPRAHRHRRRLEEIRAQHYGVPGRAGPSRANNAGVGVGVAAPGNFDQYNAALERAMAEERVALRDVVDKEFAKERRWVERRYGLPKSEIGTGVLAANADGVAEGSNEPRTDNGKSTDNGKGKGKAKEVSLADAEDEPVEEGTGVECQCCFAEYAFSRMAQCPDAHLFCISCISQYAAVQLGNMNPSLACMHADGCAMPFGELELRRVLPRKLMRLYERVMSQKAVEGLEGLEACPFCEWKCVMDMSPEVDRLFRCGNVREDGDDDEEEDEDECGVVSCRLCKKLDHTPKSCQEAEEDKHLDGQHAVEEAMTAALMRNCPKCKKAFIKEGGCNKMTCPYCGTHSCYTCRKQITGYDHFDLRPLNPGEPVAAGKCRTHDTRQLEEIHANEVKAAAEKALAEYKAAHPDAEDGRIKVVIPEAPVAPVRNRQNVIGHLGPRQRAVPMPAGQNFGNAPWGEAGGALWGGWGGVRAAHDPAHPHLLAVAQDNVALVAAQVAAQQQAAARQQALHNAAANVQPAAVGRAPPAPGRPQPRLFIPPLRQRRINLVPLQQRHDNNMGRIGAAQPQAHDQLPPQDIVMADAPPLRGHGQIFGPHRVQQILDRMVVRQPAAAVPQLQAAVPPAQQPHPNFLFHRPAAVEAPQPQPLTAQQPQPQPQPAVAPRQPVGADDYHHLFHQRVLLIQQQQQRQQMLQQQQQQLQQRQFATFAPPPAANPGPGALHHNNNRTQPLQQPPQVPARQENAYAGPAYPDVRIFDDRPVVHPPPPRTGAQPLPAPAFNLPQTAGLRQEAIAGTGMRFDAGMDMDMHFGAGEGAGMNMDMNAGAGGGVNAYMQANTLRGQTDADADAARPGARDAVDQYMQPY